MLQKLWKSFVWLRRLPAMKRNAHMYMNCLLYTSETHQIKKPLSNENGFFISMIFHHLAILLIDRIQQYAGNNQNTNDDFQKEACLLYTSRCV